MKLHSIRVLDATIYYYTHGKGPSLLFLHGHRSDALRWKAVILFLGKQFRVYAPDLPGFGRSPIFKKEPTMDNYALYMNNFIKALRLKNYLLFGGSMGGIIALKMILQKKVKTKPRKLILVGTPYDKKYWKLSSLDKILLFVGKKAKFFMPLMEKIIANDFLFFHLLWFCFPKKYRKREIINYEIRQWRIMSVNIWFKTMIDLLNVNFSQEKSQIKIPTIIVNSKNDQYLNTEKTLAGLKKLCPNNKTFFLPFSRHVPKGELKIEHLPLKSFLKELATF